MKNLKWIALFSLIQLANIPLFLIGLPICGLLSIGIKPLPYGPTHWKAGKWSWLWDNDEDGVLPPWYVAIHSNWTYSRIAFVWSALRNPVNNLRYVPGVSKVGRPLWYWTYKGRWYAKAGWEAGTGWPSLSAGAGKGFG